MTPTEKIDAALDSVLQALEISRAMLMQHQIDAVRAAMCKIMYDSYIAGSNAAHEAMKGK